MAIAGLAGGGPEDDARRALHAMALAPGARPALWRGEGVVLAACDDARIAAARDGSGRAIAVDGRLDDAAGLAARLGLAGPPPPDAELLLAAYDRWGEDFLDPVSGDIACAVWDAPARRLVLGRDPMGHEPLHYWLGGAELVFASEPRGLTALARIPRRCDPRQAALWLGHLPREPGRTFFADVIRAMPGETATWDGSVLRRRGYWRPDAIPELRLARDEDYVAAVRAALDAAVATRLPATGGVGSHLSGGLDSSGVTATAARLLASQGRRLTAYTAVPTHEPAGRPKDRFTDEGPHAAAIAALYPNIDHLLIGNDANPLMAVVDRWSNALDAPVLNPSNLVWSDAILAEGRRRGETVHLTGQFGNMGLSYDGRTLLRGLFAKGRWGALAQAVAGMRREGETWGHIGDQTVGALLPAPIRRAVRRALGRPEDGIYDYSLIRPEFLRGFDLEDTAVAMAGNLANLAGADSRGLRIAVLRRAAHGDLYRSAIRRMFGIDQRDPTADRRLFELCLSIPDDQFLHEGVVRSLGRRVLADRLPPMIVEERRRGLQAADWHVGFDAARAEIAAEVERIAASPLASEAIDIGRLRRLADDWPTGGWGRKAVEFPYKLAMSRALGAGRFIRRIEGGNA